MLMSTEDVMKKFNLSRMVVCKYRKKGMPHTVLTERSIIYDSELVEQWLKDNIVNGRYSKYKSKGVK